MSLPSRDFLGHPVGLSVLSGTEMWERFCFYGMRALLTLYMVDFLFLAPRPEHVLGYGAVRSFYVSLRGPLGTAGLAAMVYGTYTSLIYLSGLFGGFMADNVLGQRRAVFLGGFVMAAGEFLLMAPSLFFVGLAVMVVGNGFFKPNIATQVCGLYAPGDRRIDSAYSVFYLGINLGATIAPFVTGALGDSGPGAPPSWHWGFAAAGVGMLIGLAIYAVGGRALPPDVRRRRQAEAAPARPLAGAEWRAIAALCLIAFFNLFFWGCYEQQGLTIALMAQDHSDLSTPLGALKPAFVQAFNPIFILALTPAVVAFWAWQGRRGVVVSPVMKMAIGCGLAAASYALLIVPAGAIDGGHKPTWLWLLAASGIITLGELYLSPVGLSLFSQAAPPRVISLMMGVNYLSNAAGNYLAGYLGSYWERMPKSRFFLLLAAIAGVTALAIAAVSPLLRGALPDQRRDRPELPRQEP